MKYTDRHPRCGVSVGDDENLEWILREKSQATAVPVLPKTRVCLALQKFSRRPRQEKFYKGILKIAERLFKKILKAFSETDKDFSRNGQRDFFSSRPSSFEISL